MFWRNWFGRRSDSSFLNCEKSPKGKSRKLQSERDFWLQNRYSIKYSRKLPITWKRLIKDSINDQWISGGSTQKYKSYRKSDYEFLAFSEGFNSSDWKVWGSWGFYRCQFQDFAIIRQNDAEFCLKEQWEKIIWVNWASL